MVKERGLKSLLSKLRDNVKSSPYAKPEPIASSRLIATG